MRSNAISLSISYHFHVMMLQVQGRTQGRLAVTPLPPLELYILQKLYYPCKGRLIVFAYFAC